MMTRDDAELITRLMLAKRYLRARQAEFTAEIDAGAWARLLEQAELRLRELISGKAAA